MIRCLYTEWDSWLQSRSWNVDGVGVGSVWLIYLLKREVSYSNRYPSESMCVCVSLSRLALIIPKSAQFRAGARGMEGDGGAQAAGRPL